MRLCCVVGVLLKGGFACAVRCTCHTCDPFDSPSSRQICFAAPRSLLIAAMVFQTWQDELIQSTKERIWDPPPASSPSFF